MRQNRGCGDFITVCGRSSLPRLLLYVKPRRSVRPANGETAKHKLKSPGTFTSRMLGSGLFYDSSNTSGKSGESTSGRRTVRWSGSASNRDVPESKTASVTMIQSNMQKIRK